MALLVRWQELPVVLLTLRVRPDLTRSVRSTVGSPIALDAMLRTPGK
jgi:hypothetical protein